MTLSLPRIPPPPSPCYVRRSCLAIVTSGSDSEINSSASAVRTSGGLMARRSSTPPHSRTSGHNGEIPRRPLGTVGDKVSALGLGGYHLGTVKSEREAVRIVHAAIDAGITFMDNAWEYHDGRSEMLMGKAIADRRERVFLMTKLCTHGRGKREAMRQLEQSLRRLKTDFLDLWQIHECVYYDDPEHHFMRNGAVDALVQAKRDG